jgi:hypothetical protein
VAVALAHAQAETIDDPDTVMATLEDDPIYELQPVGLILRGTELAQRYYDHFFATFKPSVAGFDMRNEWIDDGGVAQEYTIWTTTGPGGALERHEVIGILTFGTTKLSGERVYGTERLLRLMFGPVYDDGVPIDAGTPPTM